MKSFTDLLYQDDLVGFARERLGFFPDSVQTEILAANPHRCLLNCTRQWGKSTITSIKAIHNAYFHPRQPDPRG